jgi:Ankyrin repeats (3 copies)
MIRNHVSNSDHRYKSARTAHVECLSTIFAVRMLDSLCVECKLWRGQCPKHNAVENRASGEGHPLILLLRSLFHCSYEHLTCSSTSMNSILKLMQRALPKQQFKEEPFTSPSPKRLAADESTCPLDKDQLLDEVFSYVGIGEYIYAGGVCRRWKGRYIKLCYNQAAADQKDKLRTSYKSSIATAARLQLALRCGLTVQELAADEWRFARNVVTYSLNPIAVLSLAKTYDLSWAVCYTEVAAEANNLQLLQWLHEHGCKWRAYEVLIAAAASGNTEMLKWLQQHTDTWSDAYKANMLRVAAAQGHCAAMKFLRAQNASWPTQFHEVAAVDMPGLPGNVDMRYSCWPVASVALALENGFQWAQYTGECRDLTPQLYGCTAEARYGVHSDVTCDAMCARKNANLVFELVHAHGCPCTCGTAPAVAALAAAAAPAAAPVAAPVPAPMALAAVADEPEAAAAAVAGADGDAGHPIAVVNFQDLLDAELE